MRLSRTLVSVALSSAQLSAEYPGLEDILLYAFDKVGFFLHLYVRRTPEMNTGTLTKR